nr:hypothetical protein CFP56_46063 [Quercus suber]
MGQNNLKKRFRWAWRRRIQRPFLYSNSMRIILTLKEGIEEFRKASYDILLKISASLKDSSAISDAPYHKLI